MFCETCGFELNNGDAFCPVCGAPVPGVPQEIPVSDMETAPILPGQVVDGGQQVISDLQEPITAQMDVQSQDYYQQGFGQYSQYGQIPTSEMRTTRVTVSGETDRLSEKRGKDQNKQNIKKQSKENGNRQRVKAKPKHLALKISFLVILLIGIGVGIWLGIRFLQDKKEESTQAYYKQPTINDIQIEADGTAYVKHQLLVRGQKEATKKQIQRLAEEKDGSIVGEVPYCNDYQIEFDGTTTKEDLEKILVEWRSKTELIAKADYHRAFGTQGGFYSITQDAWWDDNAGSAYTPFETEWDIYNPSGNNWGAESVWASKVWDSSTKYQEVKVGLLDTTFDTTHVDLKDRFQSVIGAAVDETGKPVELLGNTAVADAYRPYVGKYGAGTLTADEAVEEKRLSHGTHVAGVIGANIADKQGIAGVAQNSKLYGYSLQEKAEYQYTSVFEWECALSGLFEQEVHLINVSMQIAATPSEIEGINEDLAVFLSAYLESGKDFLLVKSAGDEQKEDLSKDFICGITDENVRNHIIIVGGAEPEKDDYGVFSGYRKTETTNFGETIDIYAPGVRVLSDIPADRTEKRDGTSDAAAFVTGGCALVMGILPNASLTEVKKIVLENCIYTVTDTNRGYLNLYMATEEAIRRSEEGSTTGSTEDGGKSGKTIREKILEEISKNGVKPTVGILELSVSTETMAKIEDIRKIKCTATMGSTSLNVTFDPDNYTSEMTVNPGTWSISFECEGYEPKTVEVVVTAGKTSGENGIELVASAPPVPTMADVDLKDVPEAEALKDFVLHIGTMEYDAEADEKYLVLQKYGADGGDRIADDDPLMIKTVLGGMNLQIYGILSPEVDSNPQDIYTNSVAIWWYSPSCRKYSGEYVNWILENIFHMEKEKIAKENEQIDSAFREYLKNPETIDYNGRHVIYDGLYYQDGSYYNLSSLNAVCGVKYRFSDGDEVWRITIDITSVQTDGEYYYVEYVLYNRCDYYDTVFQLARMSAKVKLESFSNTLAGMRSRYWTLYKSEDLYGKGWDGWKEYYQNKDVLNRVQNEVAQIRTVYLDNDVIPELIFDMNTHSYERKLVFWNSEEGHWHCVSYETGSEFYSEEGKKAAALFNIQPDDVGDSAGEVISYEKLEKLLESINP